MNQAFPDDTFLARWLSGELNQVELRQLEAREDYASLFKIVEQAEGLQLPPFSEEEAWKRLLNERRKGLKARVRPLSKWWMYPIASTIALLVGLFFMLQPDNMDFSAGIGEKLSVTLPDGSEVMLNAQSSLSYCAKGWNRERELKLRGEAFFDVKKGSVFRVNTENGVIEVIGTSFNVWSRGKALKVACYTGKVKVSRGAESGVLTAGQKICARENDDLKIASFLLSTAPSWTTGESLFKAITLKQVFEELERQFDVAVKLDPQIQSAKPYSGGFPHDNLNTALLNICEPMGLNYAFVDDKTVEVKRK